MIFFQLLHIRAGLLFFPFCHLFPLHLSSEPSIHSPSLFPLSTPPFVHFALSCLAYPVSLACSAYLAYPVSLAYSVR